MQNSTLNNCITVLMFLCSTTAWTAWLMNSLGMVVLHWYTAYSPLLAWTMGMDTASPALMPWSNNLNVAVIFLIFLTGGLLASIMSGLLMRLIFRFQPFVKRGAATPFSR